MTYYSLNKSPQISAVPLPLAPLLPLPIPHHPSPPYPNSPPFSSFPLVPTSNIRLFELRGGSGVLILYSGDEYSFEGRSWSAWPDEIKVGVVAAEAQINKPPSVDPSSSNPYAQRYDWLTRSNDYALISTQEIHQEYIYLREELVNIQTEYARTGDASNVKPLRRSRQVNLTDRNGQLRDREIDNNNAIINKLKGEYEQLQRRAYSGEGGKEEMQLAFLELKEKIQKMRQKNKELRLKSKDLGENIENGEEIFNDVKKLQNERDVLDRKKAKLEEKVAVSQGEVERLAQKLQEIEQEYIYADSFMEDQVAFEKQYEEEKRLENLYRQRNYQLEIMRKTVDSLKNTKLQKYHQLLKSLESMVEKLQLFDQKLNRIEIKNLYQKKEIMDLEEALAQLQALTKERSKTTDNNQNQNAFYTGIELDQILEREQSERDDINRRQLNLIRKPSPNRYVRKGSEFSMDSIRNEAERKRQYSSRMKTTTKPELPSRTLQKIKLQKNREDSFQKFTNISNELPANQPLTERSLPQDMIMNAGAVSNRSHYYRNIKSLTNERNQLYMQIDSMPTTLEIAQGKVEKEGKKEAIAEEIVEGSPEKEVVKQEEALAEEIQKQVQPKEEKAQSKQVKQMIEAEETKVIQEEIIAPTVQPVDEKTIQIERKKDLISKYVNQFEQEDDQQEPSSSIQANQPIQVAENHLSNNQQSFS